MQNCLFRKGLVIGLIILFVGASVVPSISGDDEEKNKTNIDIDPVFNKYIIKESFTNNDIDNGKNERYGDTQSTIFNGGNSKGWSITEVVSTESTEDSWRPSLMVDSGDVVHVTWMDYTDYGGSGQDWDIFYKYKNGGGSWSATEVVSTESRYLSEFPSLMVDSGDVVHVTWMDKTGYGGSGSDLDIFYKYKTSSGSWSNTEVVSTESTGYSYYPSLHVDSSGTVHVTWYDYTDYGGSGSDGDIFYKYKSGGNQPPNKPDINGPTSGKPGTSYNYTFISIDPGEDIVQFFIDWGDGDTEWTEFVASGTPVTRSHIWNEKSTYEIKAKAKDTDDYESEWGTLTVSMPRNRIFNRPIFSFLEQHLNLFPILRLLLQRLGLQ